MVLTIKAISYKGQPLIPPIEAVFDEQGGTLGRSSSNHLMLTDNEKVVSGEHAAITYENGSYYYSDTSLNGTFVTNRNQRIHHEKVRLEDDDKLQVGEYHLVLSISEKATHRSSRHPEVTPDSLSLSMFDQEGLESRELQITDILEKERLPDTDEIIRNKEALEFHSAFTNDQGASIDDSFVPPEPMGIGPQKGDSTLPDDLTLDDFFGSDVGSRLTASGAERFHAPMPGDEHGQSKSISRQEDRKDLIGLPERSASPGGEPKHAPRAPSASGEPAMTAKSSQSRPDKSSAELLRDFFNAAGLEEPNDFSREACSKLMCDVGTMLRELVYGLMTVLRGRSELKSHLRASMTTIKPVDNNPLKFSPTVEEALITCLLRKHAGFIDAVDAIHEGFEDIKNHQLAIAAGIQASLASILRRFEPKNISVKFNEGLVLQKKAKCWDEYKKTYMLVVEEALEDFFGEDFVRAYEEQIEKLRTR